MPEMIRNLKLIQDILVLQQYIRTQFYPKNVVKIRLLPNKKKGITISFQKKIYMEDAIRFVKHFRILSEGYRNRRKRLALRFSLLAGICNFDMSV